MDGDEKALKRVEDGYATQLIMGIMLLLFAWQTWSWPSHWLGAPVWPSI